VSRHRKDLVLNLALLAGVTALAFLAGEIALRLIDGVPLTDFSNFRNRNRPPRNTAEFIEHDPLLGWTARAHLDTAEGHTVDLGIRRNSAAQRAARPGATLAVGGSVTLGVRLADEDSWPAKLESITGRPIDNAAVVGFAMDQTLLRGEALLPILHPRTLLIAVASPNIEWARRSKSWGVPKPFFTVEDGALRAHNDPVPRWQLGASNPFLDALGHFHVVDRIMSSLDPDDWLIYASSTRGGGEPVAVTCLLLARLKAALDAQHTRAILVPEPIWSDFAPKVDPAAPLHRVIDCGRQLGYGVVDGISPFASDYSADAQKAEAYYFEDKTHFREPGNRRMAEIVAAFLRAEPAPE
jgi:hypothetical protein